MKQTTWGKDYNQLTSEDYPRSQFITDLIKKYALPTDSILEIGAGAGRNLSYLYANGFKNLTALDADKKQLDRITNKDIKIIHSSIQELENPEQYDIVFTSSCLFLIPHEDAEVFKKIEDMYKKYLITIEGEGQNDSIQIYGRDYSKVFKNQIEHQSNIFNKWGHARVFSKI